jgi:hypothetical protein
MNLKRQYDVQSIQDRDDKKKINDLYSLNQDIENKSDNKPVAAAHGSFREGKSMASATTAAQSNKSQVKKAKIDTGNIGKKSNKTAGVIKTVILPHEDINRLGLEAEELRFFLKNQQDLFEESVRGYQKDQQLRE